MFDEKQLEQYRCVKASPELQERVMKIEKSKQGKIYSFPRRIVSAAACLAVVIAVGVFFGSQNSISAEIIMSPYSNAQLYRSVNTSISIKIDAGRNSVISVSDGSFIIDGSEMLTEANVDGETQLEWFIQAQGEHILTVKKGLTSRQYILCLDEEAQSWLLEEV